MKAVAGYIKNLLRRAEQEGVLLPGWKLGGLSATGDAFCLRLHGPRKSGFRLQLKRRREGLPCCAASENFSMSLLSQSEIRPPAGDAWEQQLRRLLDFLVHGDRVRLTEEQWGEQVAGGDLKGFLDGTTANFAEVKITLRCNQDCLMCKTGPEVANLVQDAATLERLLERLVLKSKNITFSGGEPTLERELPHYLRLARRAGFEKIEVQSNGVRLQDVSYLQELLEAGANRFLISLHAPSAELSERITRAPGTFAKTVQGIRNICDGPARLELCCVISALNFSVLPDYVDFVTQQFGGRATILFTLLIPVHRVLENRWLVPRVSAVAPYLNRALARCRNGSQPAGSDRRPVASVIGGCGVTPCLIPEFAEMQRDRKSPPPQDTRRLLRKTARCRRCRFDAWCTGFWRRYAELYGTDEFVPVPRNGNA